MKQLLETTSPKYLRRLVRELNRQTDGFYTAYAGFSLRCNRARLAAGVLECRPIAGTAWFTPTYGTFTDPYGREIVASRKP